MARTIEIYHNTENGTYSVHPPDNEFDEVFDLDYNAALDEAEAIKDFFDNHIFEIQIKVG